MIVKLILVIICINFKNVLICLCECVYLNCIYFEMLFIY